MTFTTEADTIKLQIDTYAQDKQRTVFDGIVYALQSTYNLYINCDTRSNKGVLTRQVWTAGTKILELKTGMFLSGSHKDKKRIPIYYISVEMAGMKRYHSTLDSISYNCLLRIAAYLNTNIIPFDIASLDICVDMRCQFIYTYAFCNKRSSGVNCYKVGEQQPYANTHYIEKYNHTHNYVMKRAYLYDKSFKEGLDYFVTRFELKLQSRFFSRDNYFYAPIIESLYKYHILYFPTLEEKDAALSLYAQHEGIIRRRDLHKLGLDRYRVYPDITNINRLVERLYEIYEDELNLPPEPVADTGFEEYFKELDTNNDF